MATLEKRIADLEAQAASTDHSVKMYFCSVGEDEAQDAGMVYDEAIYPD